MRYQEDSSIVFYNYKIKYTPIYIKISNSLIEKLGKKTSKVPLSQFKNYEVFLLVSSLVKFSKNAWILKFWKTLSAYCVYVERTAGGSLCIDEVMGTYFYILGLNRINIENNNSVKNNSN